MATVSRRNFLKIAGAAVVAAGGIIVLGSTPPDISFPDLDYGDDRMGKKILVAYASRAGSTAEIADFIARTLSNFGVHVDVQPVKAVQSLEGYRGVVLGSVIRMGQWVPEAVEFVKNHQAQLARMPVAIFSAHLHNLDNSVASIQARDAFSAGARALVTPVAETFFAGKMEVARLNFFERMLSRAMKEVEEDRRDWNVIRAWATAIAPLLAI